MDFKLQAPFFPTGDQPAAIERLVAGVKAGERIQVLMGATGTGKTFTISHVINQLNRPTLIMVHNKTLAGQLYEELRAFFPENRVEYFVSNFDLYQPEAYIPSTATYIDKQAIRNDAIEMMRASAVNSVLTRRDTIVVCSVAAIYALGNPEQYRSLVLHFRINDIINRKEIVESLINSQYQRNDMELSPGYFRVRGDMIEIMPPDDNAFTLRLELEGDRIERIIEVNPITGKTQRQHNVYSLFPAYSHASTYQNVLRACDDIRTELGEHLQVLRQQNKLVEHQRLEERTNHDLESLKEFGICPGIENYSRHIDGRKEGETPYSLFNYFPEDFLLIVDESHVSLPQIRGMYNGDRARKVTLVEYGFRLPSALDNRPLRFEEFEQKFVNMICTTATPGKYEIDQTGGVVVEQIIRPTGLVDPIIEVRPSKNQIDEILHQINQRITMKERVLITTLTIDMAENLTKYLKEHKYKVTYLHNETKTLDRTKIIYELRKGKYDILVGINLLREGLDLPEVSLILILDADKEGFLRSESSLIQIIGRAARNVNGKVILFADKMTDSMQRAIKETDRRREIQVEYNKKHGIIPQTIIKKIHEPVNYEESDKPSKKKVGEKEAKRMLLELERRMKEASRNLDFEEAAQLRDQILELRADYFNS